MLTILWVLEVKNQNLVCSLQAFALCILLLHWIEGQFNLEEDLWIKSFSHVMPHAHARTVGYVFHNIKLLCLLLRTRIG